MPVRQNSGSKPTQSEDTSTPIFEWTENEIEAALLKLYRFDTVERPLIRFVIEAMNNSPMFWRLMAGFDLSYQP
jgi:hypothetical protein